MTLERFSLSRKYSNYGRETGDKGQELTLPADELAGHDLQRSPLQPGQSHSFALTATFSEAGEQWWYFNALISGMTQNWDTHQAHELTVRETLRAPSLSAFAPREHVLSRRESRQGSPAPPPREVR